MSDDVNLVQMEEMILDLYAKFDAFEDQINHRLARIAKNIDTHEQCINYFDYVVDRHLGVPRDMRHPPKRPENLQKSAEKAEIPIENNSRLEEIAAKLLKTEKTVGKHHSYFARRLKLVEKKVGIENWAADEKAAGKEAKDPALGTA